MNRRTAKLLKRVTERDKKETMTDIEKHVIRRGYKQIKKIWSSLPRRLRRKARKKFTQFLLSEKDNGELRLQESN